MKHYTTDPGAQGKFIRSLRELADYLDRHPMIPVPKSGATIMLHASSADYGGRAQVDHIARLLGADINDETKNGATAAHGPATGVAALGGCQACQATIAGYTAGPATSGYWRCPDCTGPAGHATVADFTAPAPATSCPSGGNTDNISETRITT